MQNPNTTRRIPKDEFDEIQIWTQKKNMPSSDPILSISFNPPDNTKHVPASITFHIQSTPMFTLVYEFCWFA